MPEVKHILIVDDEEFLCVTVADFLRDAKFRVSIVHDGSDALPIIARDQVDLVLLDLMMPRMGGFEALGHIRSKSPSTKVIILSAFGSKEQMDEADRLGADGFINKPFGIETLMKYVNGVLAGDFRKPFHEPGIQ